MLEFTERYRITKGSAARTQALPAWVCDMCPHVALVRAAHQPAGVRRLARDAARRDDSPSRKKSN